MVTNEIYERIKSDIDTYDVILFMKGTKQMPMCGFSAAVLQILQGLDVDFKVVNVLDDDEIRQGIKEFSDWPTIPQLYIKQQFIGGCDIVREMHENGELEDLLREKHLI